MIDKLRAFAKSLKLEIAVLASALADPRTPFAARALGVAVVAYAVSPIDLIPDFIPVLGFLDELILLPIALWAIRRMIPSDVLAEHRAKTPRHAVGALSGRGCGYCPPLDRRRGDHGALGLAALGLRTRVLSRHVTLGSFAAPGFSGDLGLHREGCGARQGQMTRGPIRSARALSLAGAVAPDIWCPPTLVGTTRDHDPNGHRGT